MQLQVGVKIILFNNKNQILLVQRSEKYKKIEGQWDIVGGRIEPGVGLIENLRREIKEETGIDWEGIPKLVFAQDIIGEDKHVVRLTYVGKAKNTLIKKSDAEWTNYKWFDFKELKDLRGLDKYLKEVLTTFSFSPKKLTTNY